MPFNGSFLYVGGYDWQEPQDPALFYDTVYKFLPESGQFVALADRLSSRKSYPAAMLMDCDGAKNQGSGSGGRMDISISLLAISVGFLAMKWN